MRIVLLFLAGCAAAQVQQPWIGNMLDARGTLRPVFGVGGNFVAGEAAGTALATACSRVMCIVQTDARALIGVDGDRAALYFPQTRQFARWRAGALEIVEMSVDGEILAVRANLDVAVRRDSGVWIVSREGAVLDALPFETRAVLLTRDAAIYATADELVIREARFAVSGVTELFALGEDYVEARAGKLTFALRITPGAERLYLLPEIDPRKRR